jgi:hypothetical protein
MIETKRDYETKRERERETLVPVRGFTGTGSPVGRFSK